MPHGKACIIDGKYYPTITRAYQELEWVSSQKSLTEHIEAGKTLLGHSCRLAPPGYVPPSEPEPVAKAAPAPEKIQPHEKRPPLLASGHCRHRLGIDQHNRY